MEDHPYKMESWTLPAISEYLDLNDLKGKPLYLAHKLSTRHFVKDVVESNINLSGISTLNPFANRPFLYKMGHSSNREVLLNEKENTHTAKMIVLEDLEKIKKCSGIIAYIEDASFGTAMEIFFASYSLLLPVWLIFGNPLDDLKYHPWLSYLTKGYIV